jgi:hypothetical protein
MTKAHLDRSISIADDLYLSSLVAKVVDRISFYVGQLASVCGNDLSSSLR